LWETFELFFPLHKVAFVVGAIVACVLLVLLLTKFGGSWANHQSDAEFSQQIQRTLPAAQQIVTENGVCTIHFAMAAPADKTPARQLAERVAATYQKFRSARGGTGPVAVQIYYEQTMVAKVVKE